MTIGPVTPDDWGTEPNPRLSLWEQAAQQGGVQPIHRVVCIPPGSTPVELVLDAGASQVVTQSLDLGSRWTADLTIVRSSDLGTWELVTTPGAIFVIEHGWDYGGGQTELRPYGRYRLAARPNRTRLASIQLQLADDWQALAWARFIEPHTIDSGTSRIAAISSLVADALPSASIDVGAGVTGSLGDDLTEDTDRASMLMQISRDGNLLAHFDAGGRFRILRTPELASVPAATFADGPGSQIVTLTTEQTLTAPYNALIVRETATSAYSTIAIQVGNTDSPLHRDNLGLVCPAYTEAPTAETQAEAEVFARSMLTRLVGGGRKIELSTWGRGDLEPGQTIVTYESETWTDLARSGWWLIERIEHDILTVATRITGRSSTDTLTEVIS